MAGKGDAAEALRGRLDDIELQQQEVPSFRPPHQRSPATHQPSSNAPDNVQTQEPSRSPVRLSLDSSAARARTRFADQDSIHHPPPYPRTELYTIDSHQAVPQQPGRDDPVEQSRISLTRPRQRFDDLHGNMKTAMASAEETNATLTHYRSWVGRQREKKRRFTNRPWGRLRASAKTAYKRYILEGLLRQKPIPPSKDGRHIPLRPGLVRQNPLEDDRTGRPFASNFIRSSRYTVWNFLPKQLFFQFSKLANFYFLVIGVMQMIPGLSTTGTYTTIAPLIFFVGFSMAKEGYDDYRRYQLDKQENRSPVWVMDPERSVKPKSRRGHKGLLNFSKKEKPPGADADVQMTDLEGVDTEVDGPGPWSRTEWQEVRVGDIIRLQRDDSVPADMVLLHATGPNGMAYIETMALDGETNLKSKQACPLLVKHCNSTSGMASCEAEVVSEDPNLDLYNYEGKVTVKGETMPLTMSEVVYRGSTLRNTSQTIGLVINTGEECKIRMNAHKNVHAKAPEMQYAVNRIVIVLVFVVVSLSIGLTISYQVWRRRYESHAWYMQRVTVPTKEILIGFIIVFNTLIPLSLYVSLEIVKLGQLYLLRDIEMYDPVSDTPMVANTSTILENLGQVSYVFSDKTGTLTENIMKFRKMSVAGTAWLHDKDLQDEAALERNKKLSAQRGASIVSAEKGRPSFSLRVDRAANAGTGAHRSGDAYPARTHSFDRRGPVESPGLVQPELKTETLLDYLRYKPNSPFARKARHFILCIALCHTCLPETDEDGEVKFQAASPDELALVEAARDLGYLLIDRPTQSIKLQSRDVDGSAMMETYEVLDVIEFSSKRKRMSIIIRMPDGKLCLFMKGADSVILPRLKQKQLAAQAASAVERRASMRKSMEQEKALQRQSLQITARDSMNLARASTTLDRRSSKVGSMRRSAVFTGEFDSWLSRRENEDLGEQSDRNPLPSMTRGRSIETSRAADPFDGIVDEYLSMNDAAIFDRCFQHVDDFASEGLRTLIYAYRYLENEDYRAWKKVYHDATTSLVKRQERIEDAAELIEQGLDLAGATAIEDKLQQGVPETIDKLRRANIKVWMLTGDKRETAINIAHSARITKPFSETYILDVTLGDLHERIASTLIDVGRGMVPHSVVVIDGHTLNMVEEDESLKILFFDLVARVDSVICCRASPSQKATLVKCIRDQSPSAVTLAIGDGANDIAMIQASHVGIGISGREGLQAARISDYSIAQFRFLQRLLFVHGRWVYIRTGKYILGTFWKEVVFYLLQAHFQRYNGFTGTSLFESTSLTVFNTVFTSLPVILPGIFEKDLSAATLMAVPELYTFGQRNRAFNFKQYIGWMAMAVAETVIIFYTVYYLYAFPSHSPVPTDLFSVGTLAFGVTVVFINIKLMVLETHNRTVVIFIGFLLSLAAWFVWNLVLGSLYTRTPGPYMVRGAFLHGFGKSALWWLVSVIVLSSLIVFELAVTAVRKSVWPTDQDVMQEVEHMDGVMDVLKDHAAAAEKGEGWGGGGGGGDGNGGDGGGDGNGVGVGKAKKKKKKKNGDALSIKTVTSASSGEAAAERDIVAGTGAVTYAVNKRSSRHFTGDDYLQPPFTPLAEERENSMDGAGEGRDGYGLPYAEPD
ncbi:hypothetical protein B0T25DRAFT_588001 [Lasiosphaeria hispida]|uniref:Phospholipid-transporting ATPase n=1 Tax=Lasiosphaeria hispida TaxID=260671 RepID=A0AAJ0MH57_9PEZI|nr:hypothetical protein B0T25DRAFT_588001 [Lasiosphaeria hispida]